MTQNDVAWSRRYRRLRHGLGNQPDALHTDATRALNLVIGLLLIGYNAWSLLG